MTLLAPETTAVETNKRIVRTLIVDDLTYGDESAAAAVIHPEFFDHTNPPGMQRGLEGHLAIGRLFRAAFPDMKWDIEDTIAEGDKVVVRLTMTGAHRGDFFGIPATGKTVNFTGVHILRIEDGRVAEHWGANDEMLFMRQLGVLPS